MSNLTLMPFAQVPGEILMDDRLKPTHIRVLIALYMHSNKKRELIWPKRKTLARLTGIHEATISRLTTELEQFGWVTKEGNSGGCGRPAAYRVHVPDNLTCAFEAQVNDDGDIVLPKQRTKPTTVADSATVAKPTTVVDSATVAKPTTVVDSATVADSEQNPSRIDYLTVAKSARGKEQTKNRPEQTNGGKRASAPTIPGIPDSLTADFLAVRKAKRAGPLTDTALAGIRREAEKAGLTLEQAITFCCEAGWQAFNAGWYAERQQKRGAAFITGGAETAYQRSMRERMQEAAPSIARKAPQPQQDAADFFRTVDTSARVVDVQNVRAIGGTK